MPPVHSRRLLVVLVHLGVFLRYHRTPVTADTPNSTSLARVSSGNAGLLLVSSSSSQKSQEDAWRLSCYYLTAELKSPPCFGIWVS